MEVDAVLPCLSLGHGNQAFPLEQHPDDFPWQLIWQPARSVITDAFHGSGFARLCRARCSVVSVAAVPCGTGLCGSRCSAIIAGALRGSGVGCLCRARCSAMNTAADLCGTVTDCLSRATRRAVGAAASLCPTVDGCLGSPRHKTINAAAVISNTPVCHLRLRIRTTVMTA